MLIIDDHLLYREFIIIKYLAMLKFRRSGKIAKYFFLHLSVAELVMTQINCTTIFFTDLMVELADLRTLMDLYSLVAKGQTLSYTTKLIVCKETTLFSKTMKILLFTDKSLCIQW